MSVLLAFGLHNSLLCVCIGGWVLGGDYPVYCRIFNSICGLYLLDSSLTQPLLWQLKIALDLPSVPWEAQLPLVKNHWVIVSAIVGGWEPGIACYWRWHQSGALETSWRSQMKAKGEIISVAWNSRCWCRNDDKWIRDTVTQIQAVKHVDCDPDLGWIRFCRSVLFNLQDVS